MRRPLVPVAWIVLGVCGVAAVWGCRAQWRRVWVAFQVERAHIFMPPPELAAMPWLVRVREEAEFFWDFAGLRTDREVRLRAVQPELQPLVQEIARRQSAGDDMRYPEDIYREVRWRLNFTPDVKAARKKIDELRTALAQPAAQLPNTREQQTDGSWARGIDAWYLKLYYSVDRIEECTGSPERPLVFLDRINSPAKLAAQLNTDLLDDFTKTRVFNREELDETFSGLARILFKKNVTDCYPFDPQLSGAMREFVARWQNEKTGLFGQWLLDRRGRVWKMDDMAMTFHVVSDLKGEVDHLDRIARRVLELDGVNFPAGIRFNGHYENHLNYDVVTIFHRAWPQLDEPTRQRAREEIARMLTWCLTQSYQPNGSFKVSELDETTGDAYEYAIEFLSVAGYFDRRARFWTDQEFPEAGRVHETIAAKLRAIGNGDPRLEGAYQMLQTGEP